MALTDIVDMPLDETSRAELASSGLEYTRVDPDGEGFEPFQQAVTRGFLGGLSTSEESENSRLTLRTRRLTGVYDRSALDSATPVATVDSWPSEVTVSPGRTTPLWAISGVTVAPTHRRRGIARAMLTGELRDAAAAGYALAGLTVSEATIYGRWGFSPAAWASDLVIDTRRVRWTGPVAPGRLDFVPRDSIAERLAAVHERVRPARPGAVPGWEGRWRGLAGVAPGDKTGEKVRAIVYRDVDGSERGILVYTLDESDPHDFTAHDLDVRALFADGDEALAALWRFALEHDLVARVRAWLQPAAPPVQWMIADRRAVSVSVTDHHWLRVLDVPRALAARDYAAALDLVVRVDDPLGFADGTWAVRIDDDGHALVDRAAADRSIDVETTAGALASLLLGGVRAGELAASGVARGAAPALAALDRSFAAAVTPHLDIWY